MQPDTNGYMVSLMDDWQLTVSAIDGQSIAWLTNTRVSPGFYEIVMPSELFLDLERVGYVPSVYHDGGEGPPLVLFHAAHLEATPYVWAPAAGHVFPVGDL